MSFIDRRHNQTQYSYAADDLETMREARRYSAHVFDIFRAHIGRRVLEIGSGIGTMTRKLAETADQVVGLEPNANCVARLQEAMRGDPRFSLLTCHLEECDRAELKAHRFDTVFCVNVLEHIRDDGEALRAFSDVIVPRGHVLTFVPAVQAAYGPMDAELGHHRRYSKATLARVYADAGLEMVALRYTNPVGLIGWMVNAHITKSTAHSLAQIRLFETFVAPWALPLERLITPPIGLSLIAIGQKP